MKTSFKELLGLLLLLTVPAVAQAQFTYTQNNGAIIITGYTGSGGSVFIPTTMFGLPVGIADGALSSPSITEITVDASNPYFSSVDGVLLTKSPLTVIQCPLGKTGSFTIPDGAREVGRGAFAGCRLSTVTIPSSVTSIGNRGFGDSYSLTSVTIPDSVIWMGDHVFAACTSLTNVTLDSNLGSRMFEGCRDLINVALGTNVTRIADGAFAYCTNLTRITIPNSVTNIGDGAFDGCSNLTNIWIGSGVASIGQAAFNLCWSLTAIDVDPLNAVYCSVDGVMFDRSQTVLVAYPGGKGASYTIPNGVTRIEDYAFYQCSSLTNVAIPDGVISIGDFAFTSTSLAGVTIPNAVTNLGANAFQFCNSLLEVTMPTGLTTIAGWLFCSCPRLTSITIPNGVTSIGDGAFVGCHSLTSVTVPDSASSIGGAAFWDCTSLTNVTIGNSVTNLGDYALNGCSNLRAIYFRGNAPSIDPSTFTGDTNATIYYRAGTTGWGPTFGGRPTAQWILPPPTIQMSPQTQTAEVGSTVGFQVQASGGLPCSTNGTATSPIS
jgi:hypothetical protein